MKCILYQDLTVLRKYALVFIPGLVFGRLFDMGYFKLPLFIASSVLVTAAFLVAQCKEYWQLVLCQGIAVGVRLRYWITFRNTSKGPGLQFACGAIFGPMMGILPHWFQKRLGIAYGLTATGSSLGGTLFPIAVRNLIPEVGSVTTPLAPVSCMYQNLAPYIFCSRFQWTMRILGFLLIFLLGICNIVC